MIKTTIAALTITVAMTGAASAATLGSEILSGTFTFNISQSTGVNTTDASATKPAEAMATDLAVIQYKGALDFGTFNTGGGGTCEDCTTILDWLATGSGTYSYLSGSDTDLDIQLSKPSIGSGTATATFFDIYGIFSSGFDTVIRHDDGIALFDDGVEIDTGEQGPTSQTNTAVNGFDGGEWNLLYVATNGDPSVLRVTGDDLPTTVPVPAGLPLLLTALGGVALMRRRK